MNETIKINGDNRENEQMGNNDNFKINILGTEYDLVFSTSEEDIDLIGIDGYCDDTIKKIAIEGEWCRGHKSKKNEVYFKNKTVRHELVHAFFYEAGLPMYSEDETLVEFLATKLPAIFETVLDAEQITKQALNWSD